MRVNKCIIAVYTELRYSNEAERANIYDDSKLKNPLVSMVNTSVFQSCKGWPESCVGDAVTVNSRPEKTYIAGINRDAT